MPKNFDISKIICIFAPDLTNKAMKKYILFLALVPLFMACEKGKSGIETTQDIERFVGVYSLVSNGYDDVIYNTGETERIYQNDSIETYFELRLDTSSETKLLAYDYQVAIQLNDSTMSIKHICILDSLSAYLKDGCLYFDTYKCSFYDDYFIVTKLNKTIAFGKATLDGDKLLWSGSLSAIYSQGEQTIQISGQRDYMATKIKQKADN